MDVHIHIGMGRVGSSAIQQYLYSETETLRRLGFFYPELPTLRGQPRPLVLGNALGLSFYLTRKVRRNRTDFSDLSQIAETLIEGSVGGRLSAILSSEFLFESPESGMSAVRSHLEAAGIKLHVYCYLREPLDWMLSYYAQKIKSQGSGAPLNSFIAGAYTPGYISGHLDKFARVFGADFHLRLYERKALVRQDIRMDFMDQIGANTEGLALPADINASAGAVEVEAMRILNGLIGSDHWSTRDNRRFLRALSLHRLEKRSLHQFLAPSIGHAYRRACEPELEAIREKFFPDRQGPLFKGGALPEKALDFDEIAEITYVKALVATLLRRDDRAPAPPT